MSIERLYLIQELETKEVEIQKRIKKLPQFKELKELKGIFESSQKSLHEKEIRAQELGRMLKKLEHSTIDLEIKEKELSVILYDGSVSNPKELESIQEKLNAIKEKNGSLQEEILSMMGEKEEIDQDIKAVAQELQVMYKEFNRLKGLYNIEKINLEQELAGIKEDKSEMLSQVDKKWLSWFEETKPSYSGTPVGKITDNHSCSGCHTVVPPMIVRAARSKPGEVFCEHCSRLLFAPAIS